MKRTSGITCGHVKRSPYLLAFAATAVVLAMGASSAQAQFPASFDVSTLNGTNGFAINGIDAGARFGGSVSDAGDINGDGIDDLIIGAQGLADFSTPGQSFVVFGQAAVPEPSTAALLGAGLLGWFTRRRRQ